MTSCPPLYGKSHRDYFVGNEVGEVAPADDSDFRTYTKESNGRLPAGMVDWCAQHDAEVEWLKAAVEKLQDDFKMLQETVAPRRPSLGAASSVLLEMSPQSLEGIPIQQELEVALEDVSPDEELQNQLRNLEHFVDEELQNVRGFVDAAVVALINRVSSVEIFIKGPDGLAESLERRLGQVSEEVARSVERLTTLERSFSESRQQRTVPTAPPLSLVNTLRSASYPGQEIPKDSVGTQGLSVTVPANITPRPVRVLSATGVGPSSPRLPPTGNQAAQWQLVGHAIPVPPNTPQVTAWAVSTQGGTRCVSPLQSRPVTVTQFHSPPVQHR